MKRYIFTKYRSIKSVSTEKLLSIIYKLSLAAFAITTFGGCASYHPKPLTTKSIQQNLTVPRSEIIRIKASQIRHPILKPVPFDDSNGLSPDEAAILAVICNPLLRVARDARGIAAAQVLQAGILPNPQVSYSFETPIGGDTSGKANALGLGLDWNISSLVARDTNIAAARYHATSIDLEIAWQEWQVAEAAKLHVFRLFIAEKRLTLAKAAKHLAERLYEKVKTAVTMGTETTKSLFTAWMLRQNARESFLQAQEEVTSEHLVLNRILGLPSNRTTRLEKDIHLPTTKDIPPVQELLKGIEERRLDLLALRYGYESQEERLRAAIQSQFPKISLGLTGARDSDGLKTIGIGISISIPLFDRGQGRIAIERATRQQLFDEYTARLFEAKADIARIIEMFHSAYNQLQNLNKEISNLQQLTKSHRLAANQGNISVVEYYKELLQEYTKRLQKLDIQQRLSDLAVGLEIATGQYLLSSSKSGYTQFKHDNKEDHK